jgi:hypothetical protein
VSAQNSAVMKKMRQIMRKEHVENKFFPFIKD